IHNNSRKLLKMINQLLDLSRIEAGKLELKTSQQDLVQFCRYICSAFESLAEQKKIKLRFTTKKDPLFVYFDSEKLEQVLNNLLFNAFKFTDEGFVGLQIEEIMQDDQALARITVTDSGIGIHPEQLAYVFDRFYQAHQGEPYVLEGTGIGLALCKELVELHYGKIEVSSELGKGTEFSIFLPMGCAHLAEDEIIIPSGQHPVSEIQPLSPAITAEITADGSDRHLPLLLLIEDNPDMLEYIRHNLQKDYRVLTAANGATGLEIARQEIPDLILSDVMMPGMNGFELCAQLKKDIKTDHIPIILLTARAGEEYKIKGLKVQADDYLPKPFNQEELMVRIRNLIKSRSRLRQRFAEQSLFQNVDTGQDAEDLFLKQLKEVIEDHISDPRFDVNTLSKLLGMSKSQLNRKMKAVVNKSPNQFIRSYRLAKARHLIKSTDATLSEIAYDVGFSSPAYFSKCFHDEFGFPPSSLTE
ncbi:MAG: response regulator, partial [Lewinella sp.]|nr:response regulator [Lewinella sp.]